MENEAQLTIDEKMPEIVEGEPMERGADVVTYHSSVFVGPLPHPDAFQRYDEILPGAADRILTMAENEARHRHLKDKKYIGINKLGVIFAFILGVVTIAGGILVILLSESPAAGVFVSSIGLVAIVASFINGTRPKSKQEDIDVQESA